MTYRIILSIIVLGISSLTFSQITTGRISYDVYLSSDNPQVSAYLDQQEANNLLEIYFSDNKLRSNLLLGDMATTQTVTINGEDSTLVLMDNMMGKLAMKITKNDADEEQRKAYEVKNVELVSGETKEIMGYTCKKAILTFMNDKSSEVWYTEEIVPNYRESPYLYKEIKGLPLEMHSSFMNMEMKMVAYDFKNKISKKQEAALFNLEVPKGYKIMTVEDLKKFRGQDK